VTWLPPAAGRRMENWLQNMGDWNISRKRYWGLPLPFYTCEKGHFFVLGSEEELRERAKSGLDKLRELHRPWIDDVVVGCPECGAASKRVKEVGDCWLDAGIVPFSTLDWLHDKEYWAKWFPAEYIVEMVEQVRLWFYSQLFFSVVLTGEAPYRVCESFQPMLAAPGEEFHKSGGNMVDLVEACERVGADAIRLVVARGASCLCRAAHVATPPSRARRALPKRGWVSVLCSFKLAERRGVGPPHRVSGRTAGARRCRPRAADAGVSPRRRAWSCGAFV